ncbi:MULTISPECIES: prohibitin family protein [Helicobacter]|uniref:Prohibitin family protein n=1 Tax=Helicobacter ibis TaxID=2962633 RepID=A0ABT4VCJ6_9HELI|nr:MULTISPECIES: prohibitin family protein [Helicobacter]MDA3966796.1 prohibitin family protein [Helicobacter sp. WB40]MDA3968422.1 prohibitin family protein [Helicobacter ibis]
MPIDLNEHLKNKNRNNRQNNTEENANTNNDKRGNGGFGGGNRGGGFQPKMPAFNMPSGKKMGVIYLIVALIAIIFLLKPFTIINSGEVGVKITTGEFSQTPLQPGIHFFIPGIQKIIPVNTKVRIAEFTSVEGNIRSRDEGSVKNQAISVLDSRGLSVFVELAVQYRLDPLSVPQTIATWGQNWEERIITPVIREIVRNVVGSFPAEELPVKRNEIATLIDQKFRENINSLENRPVELVSIQLTEIVLPVAIKEQIERVQVARQEAERARYEVERAKQEAEKKAALAKGVADATIIEADAQAKANKLISQSLNSPLLQLRQIEVQGQFNEALKTNKDAKIFLTPGGATPNIWLDSKDNQRASSIGQ